MGLQLRDLLIGMDTDKKVVGESKSVSWGGAWTKGKGRRCELTKNMFLHSDLLKLCLKKKRKINEFFLDKTVFYN